MNKKHNIFLPDLLIDVRPRFGRVHGRLYPHGVFVESARPDLGDVLAAVDLLVRLAVLVVLVGPQGQLGAAHHTTEAARVEEGEVLQGAWRKNRYD